MNFRPSEKILENYADVLVNYALNSGKGIEKSETVFLRVPECAKPILPLLIKKVLQAGAHPIVEYIPDDINKLFFDYASDNQLSFFPEKYLKGKVAQADHFLFIISDKDKHELEGVSPKKIMQRAKALKPLRDWRNEKEAAGKQTWTLALYGTPAMAKEANLSLEKYWNEIIKACYLHEKNPVKKWKEISGEVNRVKQKLDNLKIQRLNIKSKSADLIIGIGDNRKWLGGTGRNIPSFEIFISPDWRQTQGHIFLNQPLYIAGNLVQDIYIEFRDGIVKKLTAKKGEKFLKEMLAAENANKVGEFSLTDSRLSKITKFMASTLYDENVGGKFGNTHIALGMSYKDSFVGEASKVSKSEWEKMGFNDSVVHTDIISTEDRVVTAILKDGNEQIIYKNGKFTI